LRRVAVGVVAGLLFVEPVAAQCITGQLSPQLLVPGGQFGLALARHGDELLVGSRKSATVYVRNRQGTPGDGTDDIWSVQTLLLAPSPGDLFGTAVAIQGDTLAVGAGVGFAAFTGSVFIYRRVDLGRPGDPGDDTWVLAAQLLAELPAGSIANLFGYAVAIDGDWLAVGSKSTLPGMPPNHGLVHMYRRDAAGTPDDPSDDEWVLHSLLLPGEVEASQDFGAALQLVSPHLLIGAPGSVLVPGSGALFHFRLQNEGDSEGPSDVVWVEHARIAPPFGYAGYGFGTAVSLDGDRFLARANGVREYRRDDKGTPDDLSDDVWVMEATLTDVNASTFSLVGDFALAGLPFSTPQSFHGAAFVFRRTGVVSDGTAERSGWMQVATLTPPGSFPGGPVDFGSAVLLMDEHALVGETGFHFGLPAGDSTSGPYGAVTIHALAQGPWSFTDVALANGAGKPCLLGSGPVQPESPVRLTVGGAPSWGMLALVAGLSQVDLPFKGGVMVPAVDLVSWQVADEDGRLVLEGRWPEGVPSGTVLHLQAWMPDITGPQGFSATNGLHRIAP